MDAAEGRRPQALRLIERDPYEHPERLQQLQQELEAFRGQLGDAGALDAVWRELQEAQEHDARGRSIAIARCYSLKNRHQDVMPYDSNRVVLRSGKDDYINASRVEGLSPYCPPLVATQAPLPGTAADFWLMVHEQKVSVIVMLVSEAEMEKVRGRGGEGAWEDPGEVALTALFAPQQKMARYFPTERGQPMVHGALSLALSSVRTTETHVERVLSLQFRDQSLKRSLVHLHFPTWPELCVCCPGWLEARGGAGGGGARGGPRSGLTQRPCPAEACRTAPATCCASSRRCTRTTCTSDPCTHPLSCTAGRVRRKGSCQRALPPGALGCNTPLLPQLRGGAHRSLRTALRSRAGGGGREQAPRAVPAGAAHAAAEETHAAGEGEGPGAGTGGRPVATGASPSSPGHVSLQLHLRFCHEAVVRHVEQVLQRHGVPPPCKPLAGTNISQKVRMEALGAAGTATALWTLVVTPSFSESPSSGLPGPGPWWRRAHQLHPGHYCQAQHSASWGLGFNSCLPAGPC